MPREVVNSLHYIAIYTDGSVTKDQSVLGSTVKHCGKTTQEDIGTNNAINFKLTGEVETVICVVQWLVSQVDTKMTHASILTACLKLLEKNVESEMSNTVMYRFLTENDCISLVLT